MAFAYYRPKANYDSGSQLVLDMSRCLLFDLRSRSKPELRRPNAFSELWISCWHLTMLHNEVGQQWIKKDSQEKRFWRPVEATTTEAAKKKRRISTVAQSSNGHIGEREPVLCRSVPNGVRSQDFM